MNNTNTNYKQTEIGEIPEEWIVGEVKDLVRIVPGYAFKSKSFTSNGLGVIKISNVSNRSITVDGLDRINLNDAKKVDSKYYLSKGDVCLAMTGANVGKIGKVNSEEKYLLNQRVAKLKGDKNVLEFIYQILASSRYRTIIENKAHGSAQPNISGSALGSIKIPIPSQKEIIEIASILSSLDDKIELNRKMNQTLEEIGKALFRQWFVDFEFPNNEGRPYKSSGGEMVDSELGEIPKGWEVASLKDVCQKITNGGTPSRKNKKYWIDEDISWIKSKELNNSVLLDSEEKISKLGLKNSSAKLLPKDTVVIALYGATVGQIGILKEEMSTNQACTALISEENFSYSFLYFYLLINQKRIFNLARGAAQQNISKGIVESLKLIKPSQKFVNEKKAILESLLDKIENNTRATQLLMQLRDSLLPRLISGKLRVKQ